MKVFLLVILPLVTTSQQAEICDFNQETSRYYCKNINNQFPDAVYGRYQLDCINCRLPIVSNSTFSSPTNLLSLNLTASKIRQVKRFAFSRLRHVEHLHLQANQISSIEADAFGGLNRIFELNLAENDLTHLPDRFLGDLDANLVDLSRNRISEVPNRIFNGTRNILMLDLSQNNISSVSRAALHGMEGLEVLNLEMNKICNLPLGVFERSWALRQLDLSDNRLSKLTVGAFSGLRNLYSLNLANNSLVVFDGSFLLAFNQLSRLDVSGNGIYYFDAVAIRENAPTIRTIRIDDNPFYCGVLINIVQYFKKINVEVANLVGRFGVQNVNGIACAERTVDFPIRFEQFLLIVEEEAKKNDVKC